MSQNLSTSIVVYQITISETTKTSYHASTISMRIDPLTDKFADGRSEVKVKVRHGKRTPVDSLLEAYDYMQK